MSIAADVLQQHPLDARNLLLQMRTLILETAAETPGVGKIEEALKWGQLSFLTTATGSGSTIRIDVLLKETNKCAMFFHCKSGLIADFRERYSGRLKFGGERLIEFSTAAPLPIPELKHCISLALTHHLRKNTAKRKQA
jgi:Domain of unknown function (DU1801)